MRLDDALGENLSNRAKLEDLNVVRQHPVNSKNYQINCKSCRYLGYLIRRLIRNNEH